MKKKANRDLIILIILIPVFLIGAFYISSRAENVLPAYSVANKSGNGYSIFFEALEELGYPVSRTLAPADEAGTDAVQIVVENPGFDVNDEQLKAWVGDGGNLVYLVTDDFMPVLYGLQPAASGDLRIYSCGEGKIIRAEAPGLSNSALARDTGAAYALLEEIDGLQANRIDFNEASMFAGMEQKSLWSQTPVEIKFIFYQLLLFLAGWFYYKSKRFGKPVPLYEEAERSENEYLYSVASLYRHAGCYDLLLEDYYRHFLLQLRCTHDNWLDFWKRENLPKADVAQAVFDFMHRPADKTGRKKYTRIITMLEQLSRHTASLRTGA